MSFDWEEYLHLAKEQAGQPAMAPSQDARLRTAVSRAYYSAFCKARNYLRDRKGVSVSFSGEAHREVWDWFRKGSTVLDKQIGEYGQRLRGDRNKADYDDIIQNLPSLTTKALTRSERINSYLDTHP